jgi:hypothetical protein
MRKHVLAFTASALISFGVFGQIAQAQVPEAPHVGSQQSPTAIREAPAWWGYHGMPVTE